MALNVKKVNKLSEPGRYCDGAGLYAQITSTGRSWVLRYETRGRERWMGLGPLRDFTLDEARERARKARQLLRDGIDPLDAKKAERDAQALDAAKRLTFEEAARQYFDQHERKWSNEKHRRQFLSSLTTYAFSVIGKIPVAMIDTTLVLRVVEPIWHTKAVTAGRVRNRIEAVLDWSGARGYRTGPNPARWKGHLETILPAKTLIKKVIHHRAMPYDEVPAFMTELATHEGIDARALELLILTAARTSEVILARRSEFDLSAKVWIVPAERMKGRREHRVPLVERALAILKKLPRENDYAFVGSRKDRPLNKITMTNVLKGTVRSLQCAPPGNRPPARRRERGVVRPRP
jgi:integrase